MLKKYIVKNVSSDLRLDKYLKSYNDDLSRAYITSLINDGKILVNGYISKPSYIVQDNDVIDCLETKKE